MDRKWVTLSNTTIGTFMALLDSSIVLVSLPTIGRELPGAGPGERPEFTRQFRQGVRATGVAQYHRIPGRHGELRHGATDAAASDQPHSCHGRRNPRR